MKEKTGYQLQPLNRTYVIYNLDVNKYNRINNKYSGTVYGLVQPDHGYEHETEGIIKL